MSSNRHLREVLIFVFCLKKTNAEAHHPLHKVYWDFVQSRNTPKLVPSLLTRWLSCWLKLARRKAKALRRCWFGDIARWWSVPDARGPCVCHKNCQPSNFQSISDVKNDGGSRNFGSSWFEPWDVERHLFNWEQPLQPQKSNDLFITSLRFMKNEFRTKVRGKKVLGPSWSCFYAAGLP